MASGVTGRALPPLGMALFLVSCSSARDVSALECAQLPADFALSVNESVESCVRVCTTFVVSDVGMNVCPRLVLSFGNAPSELAERIRHIALTGHGTLCFRYTAASTDGDFAYGDIVEAFDSGR